MPTLAGLLRLADRNPLGPAPTFDAAHLVLAFITIGRVGTIGRQSLASNSGLGAGAIRTILGKLKDAGLADSSASGCHLTSGGKEVYSLLESKMTNTVVLPRTDLTIGIHQVALTVRRRASSVKGGIEQRDSAIKVGASGATSFVHKGGKFTIPGGSQDCEKDFPGKAWVELRRLGPRDDDVVILCGASDETRARLGALAAALSLL